MPRRQLTNEERELSKKRRLEKERERQRARRLNPEFRAKERARNTVAKRLSRAKSITNTSIKNWIYNTNSRQKCLITPIIKEQQEDLVELNSLKKEQERERKRLRRLDPNYRTRERARNTALKRISRQKMYSIQEYSTLSEAVSDSDNTNCGVEINKVIDCECCGDPISSDHVCFSNILSVELSETDFSTDNFEKINNDSTSYHFTY
ncbi:uncharacterized protein LOC126841964 [Adelges cooleyi]|uniref:uncharacterized protein LOC126841964 n=1 Tax=Adelges cooleyi TaxID=133065 RepID=UPI0021800807|nr:uncharacterized protein LOC126841964 [Adelges cooleyi]XP_050434751.1 uncharacterized protein LOC126841964 [Adelges cooleyi]